VFLLEPALKALRMFVQSRNPEPEGPAMLSVEMSVFWKMVFSVDTEWVGKTSAIGDLMAEIRWFQNLMVVFWAATECLLLEHDFGLSQPRLILAELRLA
jgi:hypothetical protein